MKMKTFGTIDKVKGMLLFYILERLTIVYDF